MSDTPDERLETLEREIIRGQAALAERNELVASLALSGHTQADLTRRLNRVREAAGARPLTPDALFVIVKRYARRRDQ